ncbi:MAG: lamin tail domain-containing protein [Candidatus Cloacimonadota bacterium]|nr:lamin tail domain-containing protein [Candidatus Cloacimonadota bacterium]
MKKIALIVIILTLVCISLSARQVKEGSEPSTKMLDIFKIHDIGAFQLRTSNYGCLGSGDDVVPQWPSLEFPKGSGIDYLYIGALWFGASKQRRNEYGQILYWQNPEHEETGTTNMGFGRVIDTLTTVGFDGDADMYELLPAYNPLEENALGAQYYQYNSSDSTLKFYYSDGIPNYDDDEDGLIDEDPIGMIGFPYDPDSIFCFTMPYDDDGDSLVDEDGGYYGAENIMSYSYDYSPFGTPGTRWWGGWNFGQGHTPLNIAVKQESFCWNGYKIEKLALLKTTIYNMNELDTLFDYTLGYFFDCDIGPQSWSSSARSTEDVSTYYLGDEYEFPYSYDYDGDGGLTEGYAAAKIFSPQLYANYACWTWEVGDGPYDESPARDRNEKYWLMTDRNPNEDKYISLRDYPNAQVNDPCDTRFLYAYYGDMNGFIAPTDSSLNIAPGDSAVIYSTIFLGDNFDELTEIADILQQFHDSNFDLAFLNNYYSDLFFSEYIEGSSQNKALEIYNDTGSEVALSNYRIAQAVNGNGWEYWHTFPASAFLPQGDVWVITTDEADTNLQNVADEILSYPSVVHFNGNDARGLEKTTDGGQTWELIDVIGIPDENPGDGWDVAGIPNATQNHTLVRKDSVFKGNIDWTVSAGTNSDNSEWIVYPEDTFEYLGFHGEGGIPPTTFVNTTQGTIDSCRVGAGIHFKFSASPFAAYYKYRLVYYERVGTDSFCVEWNEDTILDSTEWYFTEDYENPDEVILRADYPGGNPFGKPFLQVNEFNEVTQLQVKAVNYAGMEDPNYAKMTFFVRGHFKPETCPFMSSWQEWPSAYYDVILGDIRLNITPHIYILGENTYLTYLSTYQEEIPYEIVSGECHYANRFYMDINEDLSAIWSDDIKIYLKWSYLGEYEFSISNWRIYYAEHTYSYDESLPYYQYQRYFCDIEFMDIQLDGSADGIPPIGTVIIDDITGEEWMRVPISEEQACTLTNLPSGSHILKVRAVDLQGALDPTPEMLEFTLHEKVEQNEKEGVLIVDDTKATPLFAVEDSVDIFYDNLLEDCPHQVTTFDLNEEPFHNIADLNIDIRNDNLAPYFAPSDIQEYKLILWHSNNPREFYNDIAKVHLIQHYDLLSFYLNSGGNLVFTGCAKVCDPYYAKTNFLQDYAGLADTLSALNTDDIVWGNPSVNNSPMGGASGSGSFEGIEIDSLNVVYSLAGYPFPQYFGPTPLGAIGSVTFLNIVNAEEIFTCIPGPNFPDPEPYDGAPVGSKYIKIPGVNGLVYILGFPLFYFQVDQGKLFLNKVFDEIDSLWSIDDEGPYTYNSNQLFQNYPNPMRGSTTISFSIHQRDIKDAEIKIYNIKGQLIKTLECINRVNAKDTNSLHSIFWNGKDKNNKPVSSGIYFYRLETENYQSSVKKLLLLR